jgi:hypothetical protein
MVWFGGNGFGLACVESYDVQNPFVDHTLRLIQHNWVVLAYNFNIVTLVLIIRESSTSAISAIILFLHLLSTNHKCTQHCYFPLLLKSAAQKDKVDCNNYTLFVTFGYL